MSQLLIKNGKVILGQDAKIESVDLLIKDKTITEIRPNIDYKELENNNENITVIDASEKLVSPGFIQTHLHFCQTLFRGSADDLELLDWLRLRVWPMEASHNPASLSASTLLSLGELIKSGTTSALTMETVHHTETVLEVVEKTGFRATIGKCMMDKGYGVPSRLSEKTKDSLNASLDLIKSWKSESGRVSCCFAPRFAISCTQELLETISKIAQENNLLIHTHASENLKEIEVVQNETGLRNVEYLQKVGLAGKNIALAHCVHVNEYEQRILAETGTHVLHCPSSNLKLGSGLAPITEMLELGVSVSIGADGAPCNNNLDMFKEMRLAALLQKMRYGSSSLPAKKAFYLATLAGAKALGLEEKIGSIEVGKTADIIIVNLNQLHSTPTPDLLSALVYSANASDVETVIIDGQILMYKRELKTLDEKEIIAKANKEYSELVKRAGI
ncbi:MAG: 5'-deoxyadenosine deaminase [Acidobacteria bacterium]|nr:5'-deoxyadenosine deaminase [Acidobacteriota bacterium]